MGRAHKIAPQFLPDNVTERLAELATTALEAGNIIETQEQRAKEARDEIASLLAKHLGDAETVKARAQGYELTRSVGVRHKTDNDILAALMGANRIERIEDIPPFIDAKFAVSTEELAKASPEDRELYATAVTEEPSVRILIKPLH